MLMMVTKMMLRSDGDNEDDDGNADDGYHDEGDDGHDGAIYDFLLEFDSLYIDIYIYIYSNSRK